MQADGVHRLIVATDYGLAQLDDEANLGHAYFKPLQYTHGNAIETITAGTNSPILTLQFCDAKSWYLVAPKKYIDQNSFLYPLVSTAAKSSYGAPSTLCVRGGPDGYTHVTPGSKNTPEIISFLRHARIHALKEHITNISRILRLQGHIRQSDNICK